MSTTEDQHSSPSPSKADRAAEDELLAALQRRHLEMNTTTTSADSNAAAAAADGGVSQKNETVTNVLLSMLDGEVHRLKTIERSQNEGMERRDRDNKRMAVMLSMSHDQLEHFTARNEKLHVELTEKSAALVKALDTIEGLQGEVHALKEDKRAMRILQTENETTAQGSLAKLSTDLKILKDQLKLVEEDRDQVRVRAEESSELAQAESRKAFELRVALETRVRTLEEESRFLSDLRAKETKSSTSREYDLSIKLRQQGLELADVSSALDAQKRQSTEVTFALKTENSALEGQVRRLERDLQESQRTALETSTKLSVKIKQLSEENESLLITGKSREQVLEGQTGRLTSDLLSIQTQLTSEENRCIDQHKEATRTQIELNAIKDAAEQRLANTLLEVDRLKNKLDAQQVSSHATAQDHARALGNQERQATTALTAVKCDLEALRNDLSWKEGRLDKAEQRVEELVGEVTRLKNSHITEVTGLKTEIGGYQHAVKVLDTHIQENHENKILVQKLRTYEGQIEHLKNQLVSSNSAIANARVESDIADSYRVELLRDQIESDSHQRAALERERRSARQLLDVLMPFFNAHQAQLAASGSSAGGGGSGGTMLIASSTNNNNNASSVLTNASPLASVRRPGGGGGFESHISSPTRALLVNASSAAAAVEERQHRALALVGQRTGAALIDGTVGCEQQLLDVAAAARTINAYYRTYGGP